MTALADAAQAPANAVHDRTLRLVFVAVFAVALIPRLFGRDQFITSDEDQWMSRSGGFAYALTTGELRRTYQNGHPGVTTMWLGVLSMGPERALQFADRVSRQRFVAAVPEFWDALIQARIGPIVVTSLTVATIGLLAGKIWGGAVGFLAGADQRSGPVGYWPTAALAHRRAVDGFHVRLGAERHRVLVAAGASVDTCWSVVSRRAWRCFRRARPVSWPIHA